MKSFLQSKQWADFQESLGFKTWRINNILIIKRNLPFGKSYFYSPRCEGKFLSKEFIFNEKGYPIFGYVTLLNDNGWGPIIEKTYVGNIWDNNLSMLDTAFSLSNGVHFENFFSITTKMSFPLKIDLLAIFDRAL